MTTKSGRADVSTPKGYAKRIAKGSAVIFIALIASGFISFFLRVFLARSLSAAEYGLFYAIFALISLFAIFRDLGLNSALVKYIPEFAIRKQFAKIRSSMASALIIQAAFGLITLTAIFVFSDRIALAVFGTLDASLPLKVLSIWFLVAMFYLIFRHAFQGFQNMLAYASIEFFSILLVLLSTALFVGILHLGISGVALAYLLAASAMCVFSLTFFVRGYPQVFKEKSSITKPLIKKLLAFALPVFIGGLGGMIVGYTDTLMITVFRSLDEVGFYQTAQPAARILWYFSFALTTILFPVISELWTRRKRKILGQALHFLTKFSFMLIIPAALVFIAFPSIVINLLFGPKYLAGAAALQILAGAAIVYTLLAILSYTMAGIGKPIVNTKVVALMACFNLVGNLILVPPYGIEGAAIATLTSYLIGFFLTLYFVRRFIKFTLPVSSLFKTFIGGLLTLFLIFGLKSILVLPPWPEAFAVVIPSLVFYSAWILATKAVTKNDMRLIARIVPMPGWLVRAAGRFIGE